MRRSSKIGWWLEGCHRAFRPVKARWEAEILFRRRKTVFADFLCVQTALAVLMLATTSVAEQSPPPNSVSQRPSAQATVSKKEPVASPAAQEGSSEGHERVLGVIPAFEMTNRQGPPALTPREKFNLFARQAFDPFQWVIAGATAGVDQAGNTWPGYGQGAAGYAKRYGAVAADSTDREFMSNFLFPVLLKQDPRYFRLGHGRILRRIAYSLGQEWWGKTDSGVRQFNYSKVLGAFAAKTVSNIYYPQGDRGFAKTMRNSGISLVSGMVTNLASEFWPDINCRLFHNCHNP